MSLGFGLIVALLVSGGISTVREDFFCLFIDLRDNFHHRDTQNMTKAKTTPKKSGFQQRASGGTTGRPHRVPRTDRNQPIVSLRVEPGNTPAHGVSGYPTTGIAGGFNYAYNSPGITTGNVDPAASRFSLQATAPPLTRSLSAHTFGESHTATPVPVGSHQVGNLTAEPSTGVRLFHATPATAPYMAYNQQLQARGGGGASSGAGYFGHLDGDLTLQGPDTGRNADQPIGETPTPAVGVNLFGTPPRGPIRQGDQPSGTVNNTAGMRITSPSGFGDLHAINNRHTPQHVTAGYSAPGTHMAHGPVPHANYDGSWTIDVLPPERPIGLLDLPPAADIPIQTYSGYTPQNSSVQYMRPSAGKFIHPNLQYVAPVPVFT